MQYADLHVFPDGHPPSPYDHPVTIVRDGRFGDGFLPPGLQLRAVGWIEQPSFPTGPVPQACIVALAAAHSTGVFRDGTRGIHTCTLCGRNMRKVRWGLFPWRILRLKGHGHYLVRRGDTVYMAPELLLHYIREHRYLPPEEFVDAVLHGRLLGADDLDIRWRDARTS